MTHTVVHKSFSIEDSGDESDVIDIHSDEDDAAVENDICSSDDDDDHEPQAHNTPTKPPRSTKTPLHTVTKRIVALTPGKKHYQYISPSCSGDNVAPIRCASMSPDPFASGSDMPVITRVPLEGLKITNESPQSPSRSGRERDEPEEEEGEEDQTHDETLVVEDTETHGDGAGDTTLVTEPLEGPAEAKGDVKVFHDRRLPQSDSCLTRKRSPSAMRILTAHTHPQNSPSERVIYSWSDTSPDASRFQYKDSSPYSDVSHVSAKNDSTPPTMLAQHDTKQGTPFYKDPPPELNYGFVFRGDSDKENRALGAPDGAIRTLAGVGSEICDPESPIQPRKRRKNELRFGDQESGAAGAVSVALDAQKHGDELCMGKFGEDPFYVDAESFLTLHKTSSEPSLRAATSIIAELVAKDEKSQRMMDRVRQRSEETMAEAAEESAARISQLETDKEGLYLVIDALRREVASQKHTIGRLRAECDQM